jgi:Domain of unknown function (DUF4261)
MPKGFYTQCLCVLLKKPVSLSRLLQTLSDFEIAAHNESYDNWAISGPACIIPFRLEVNGLITVDVVERTWPDDMGDPQTSPEIFGPWSLGAFGPAAFPGCLQRAVEFGWRLEQAEAFAQKHRAFIRARTTYSIGAGDDDPIMPADCDAVKELRALTTIVRKVLRLPEALCYFNPSGEALLDREYIQGTLRLAKENEVPPLDLWSSTRCFELESGWTMADMVGNYQLDLADMEAYFAAKHYEHEDVTQMLYDIGLYLLGGERMKDGDTCGGPGEMKWKVRFKEESIAEPSRRVMTLTPCDKRPLPKVLSER